MFNIYLSNWNDLLSYYQNRLIVCFSNNYKIYLKIKHDIISFLLLSSLFVNKKMMN